jgi:acetyl-CoA carboxylase carboxyl transferase subunit alpha
LGIGVCDRLLILEYAYYSVISPEGCAAILWKSAEMAERAADALQLAAPDLERFGIADEIVSEPLGGAHRNPREMAASLAGAITRHLDELTQLPTDDLLQQRYAKVRALGKYQELDPQTLETAS